MKSDKTFDSFFVHEGNKVAFTAAKKVAEAPGVVFNPLFIHGPAGSGKTHLLEALGAALKVDIMPAADFENALMEGYKFDAPLIIDDIHQLGEIHRKRLKSIVERALQENIQLCFSSEVPPRAVSGFSSKLCSLIESGMVCELTAPDNTVRAQMIRRLADDAGILLADDTVDELARIATGSFGAIDGMIRRLVAYSSLGNLMIDANSIRLMLKDHYVGTKFQVVASILEQAGRDDIWSLADVDDPQVVQEYERRIEIWEMKGYDVAQLKGAASADTLRLRQVYHDYIGRIRELIELQQLYYQGGQDRPPAQALQIESMLYDPLKTAELRRLLARPDTTPAAAAGAGYRRFSEFIIGFCNKLVWDAYHEHVLEEPASRNPLVVIGAAGTGKSHFLEAACDDLLSRNKNVFFHDLAQGVADLTAAERHDVLVLDNLDAVFNATESVIGDVGDLIEAFRAKNLQVIIDSKPDAEAAPMPAALKSIVDAGVTARLERPSADVVREYMRRKSGLEASGEGQVLPDFASFNEIDYYLQSLTADGQAVIPLGFDGETSTAEPAPVGPEEVVEDRAGPEAALDLHFEVRVENLALPELTEELIEEQY